MIKYLIFSIVGGLILGQSFLSYGFFWLVFVGFVPIMWVEHQLSQENRKRKAITIAFLSYLSFVFWNAVAYWWLHWAKDPDGSNAWLAYTIPVFTNAFFMTICFMLYHWVKRQSGNFYGLFFLPLMWMVFEKLHLEWELSWPWLNLGNVFAWQTNWVQWYEYTGAFGGTVWVFVVNILFFYQLQAFKNTRKRKFLFFLFGYSILLIGLPIVISQLIYNNYKESGKSVFLTVLQPNLDSYKEKYEKSSEAIVDDLIQLMQESEKSENSNFFIAPETAFPGNGSVDLEYLEHDFHTRRLKNFLTSGKSKILVSGVELHRVSDNKESMGDFAFQSDDKTLWIERYNSAIAIQDSQTIGIYHKSKLVPGVEIVPYQNTLGKLLGSFLFDFGGSMSSLTPQKDRKTFNLKENKIVAAPLICYESVYGEFSGNFIKENNANVFFIMTNDSWWGNSDGHKQLLAFAKLRAIEHRRAIARAANTGISCFINAKGEIINQLEFGAKGFLSSNINTNNGQTFYTKYGDYLARIALLLWGILLGYSLAELVLKKINNKPKSKFNSFQQKK